MNREEAIKYAKENILAYTSEMTEFKAMAIEALEKADKYRWHNLRENPDDLPVLKLGYEYVEAITDGDNNLPFPIQYDDAIMKFGEQRSTLGYDSEFEEWNTERFEEIIAWRYIEEFKAGETE